MTTKITTTTLAREKYAEALAGTNNVVVVSDIAFGNEGHDAEGEPIDPDPDWIEVPGELLVKPLESFEVVDGVIVDMFGILEQDELIGSDISSAGIYDNDGDLLAVATFNPIPKGDDDKLELDWDTIF